MKSSYEKQEQEERQQPRREMIIKESEREASLMSRAPEVSCSLSRPSGESLCSRDKSKGGAQDDNDGRQEHAPDDKDKQQQCPPATGKVSKKSRRRSAVICLANGHHKQSEASWWLLWSLCRDTSVCRLGPSAEEAKLGPFCEMGAPKSGRQMSPEGQEEEEIQTKWGHFWARPTRSTRSCDNADITINTTTFTKQAIRLNKSHHHKHRQQHRHPRHHEKHHAKHLDGPSKPSGAVALLACLLATLITLTLTNSAEAVDCFKCSSRNGSNPACEDPFHNLNTTRVSSPVLPDPSPSVIYHTPCYAGKKGRDGLFPASACIKLTGTFDTTGETLVVRHCALDSGTLTQDTELARMSHCGKFQFEGDLLKGCVLACPEDACNSAPPPSRLLATRSHLALLIVSPAAALALLLHSHPRL